MLKLLKDTINMAFGMAQNISDPATAALIMGGSNLASAGLGFLGGGDEESKADEERAKQIAHETEMAKMQENYPGQEKMLYPTSEAPLLTRGASVAGAGLNVLKGEEVTDEQKYGAVQPSTPAALSAKSRAIQNKMLNRKLAFQKIMTPVIMGSVMMAVRNKANQQKNAGPLQQPPKRILG